METAQSLGAIVASVLLDSRRESPLGVLALTELLGDKPKEE